MAPPSPRNLSFAPSESLLHFAIFSFTFISILIPFYSSLDVSEVGQILREKKEEEREKRVLEKKERGWEKKKETVVTTGQWSHPLYYISVQEDT